MSAREAETHLARCMDVAASLELLGTLVECCDPDRLEDRDPEALRNVGRMARVLSDSLCSSVEFAQVAVRRMAPAQP